MKIFNVYITYGSVNQRLPKKYEVKAAHKLAAVIKLSLSLTVEEMEDILQITFDEVSAEPMTSVK